MSLTLGDSYNPAAVTPMCTCTELGHDDVRRLIKAKRFENDPRRHAGARMEDSGGCAGASPMLNYYLVLRLAG